MGQLQPLDGNKRRTWPPGATSQVKSPGLLETAALAQERRWLRITLLFALFCGAALLWWAFRTPYVVVDDARQHLFWMQRFQDPALLQGDLTADYFQSLSPPGYTVLYWLGTRLGVAPLLLGKLLPPVLLLITGLFAFRAACALWGDPAAAGIGTLLYLQLLAANDDLPSGTPRAFIAPLLTGFLYFLVARRHGGMLLCLVLLAAFYPQVALLALGVLVLYSLDWGRFGTHERPPIPVTVAAMALTLAVVLPYQGHAHHFGPLVTAEQARVLPEFGPGARSEYFTDSPLQFWTIGWRSGFVPLLYHSPLLWAGFALPFWLRRRGAYGQHGSALRVLTAVAAASILLFVTAHLLLFKLHLPSRYIRHTLPLALALACGPVLVAGWRWVTALPVRSYRRHALLALAAALLIVPSLLVPFWNPGMLVGRDAALYRFIAGTPRETVVASLSEEAENLPVLTGRSNLFSSQCALAYHRVYYHEMEQRATDLLRAQYGSEPEVVREALRRYRVDYFVLDRDAYEPGYLDRKPWLQPFVKQARVQPVANPVVREVMEDATVLDTGSHRVLDVRVLQQRLASD